MNKVFVDTNYFVAVLNPADQWHNRAIEAENRLGEVLLVTSDFVLVEVLNYFSGFKPNINRKITASIRLLVADIDLHVVECSRDGFEDGLSFYESRIDKGYSLTDCNSMHIMRELQINEILTHREHFSQEGFQILM